MAMSVLLQRSGYRNGLPTEYTIRENSNNITDQTEQARMMHLIDKTLFHHKRIAKVKQILFSNGVAELAQPEVRENLRSKFREEAVPRPHGSIEWIETTQINEREEGVTENMDYDAHLYTHIMGEKRGNGKSMSGWSYDHIQDLITIDPEVFELLRVIIPCLHEMREEAEEKYKMNKGTVLN